MNKLFIIINFLIIISGLIIIFISYTNANRYFSPNTIYIAPNSTESRLYFSNSDIDILEIHFPFYNITPVSHGYARLSSAFADINTPVVYTKGSYFDINSFLFIEGGVDQVNEYVIVINDILAWRLFGTTTNLTGMAVIIDDIPYIITGVISQGNDNFAWLPFKDDMTISSMYIQPFEQDTLALYTARNMLGRLNKQVKEYSIVDIDRFTESIMKRLQVLLYICWLVISIILGIYIFKNKESMIKVIISGLFILVCFYALLGIQDILNWFPNITDVNVFQIISSTNIMPPDNYLSYALIRLLELSGYANIIFIICTVCIINIIFAGKGVFYEK